MNVVKNNEQTESVKENPNYKLISILGTFLNSSIVLLSNAKQSSGTETIEHKLKDITLETAKKIVDLFNAP